MARLALIEGGGTKFLCAASADAAELRGAAITRVDTADPAATVRAIAEAFAKERELAGIGLACFGPLDVDPASATRGRVLRTPKPGWSGFDVAGEISRALALPIAFHTDVVAAALGEAVHGAARSCRAVLYLTAGTGIGGGFVVDGAPIHGAAHAEMGHVPVPRENDDAFEGACPFHGDCLEGLASGTALARRVGRRGESLADDDPEILRCARYVGAAVAGFALTLAPDRIVIGGGVARRTGFLANVRREVAKRLGGYVAAGAFAGDLEAAIVAPALGERSALFGALELASRR